MILKKTTKGFLLLWFRFLDFQIILPLTFNVQGFCFCRISATLYYPSFRPKFLPNGRLLTIRSSCLLISALISSCTFWSALPLLLDYWQFSFFWCFCCSRQDTGFLLLSFFRILRSRQLNTYIQTRSPNFSGIGAALCHVVSVRHDCITAIANINEATPIVMKMVFGCSRLMPRQRLLPILCFP